MKIGINGERLLIEDPAGPEKYTYHITNALAKIDQENDYVIYFKDAPDPDYFAKLTNGNLKFKPKVISDFVSWTQVGLASELAKEPVDVFFTAVHTMPILRTGKTKIVAMIHGLEYKYEKNPNENPVHFTAEHADLVIVPSRFTKSEVLSKKWNITEDKIKVVAEGVDSSFSKRPDSQVEPILQKYNLKNKNYLLFVSTINPRKNLPMLVAAFSEIVKKDATIKLAVAGKLGQEFEESLAAPKKFGIEDSVIFLGRTPDVDLPALFSGSLAYVTVSLEEGFGLTLLEAMACHTPCIASEIGPFKDVSGDFVFFVNQKDLVSIKGGISSLTRNYPTFEFLSRAAEHAKTYTWEKAATETLRLIKAL